MTISQAVDKAAGLSSSSIILRLENPFPACLDQDSDWRLLLLG
jgi:hypothetical protein